MTDVPDSLEDTYQIPRPRSRLRKLGIVLAWILGVLLTIVGCGLLTADAMDIEVFTQTGHAMIPSLPARTRFLRIPFRDREPRRGEMVVLRDAFGSGSIVRRVIGVAGDRVVIEGFSAKVNGRVIGARAACPPRLRALVCMRERLGTETWLATWSARARPKASQAFESVPRGFVYLLADHRDVARDSRDPLFGLVPLHGVLGYIVPLRQRY